MLTQLQARGPPSAGTGGLGWHLQSGAPAPWVGARPAARLATGRWAFLVQAPGRGSAECGCVPIPAGPLAASRQSRSRPDAVLGVTAAVQRAVCAAERVCRRIWLGAGTQEERPLGLVEPWFWLGLGAGKGSPDPLVRCVATHWAQ